MRRRPPGRRLAAALALALGFACPGAAGAHPLHTTITEVAYDPATRSVQAVVRVFEDDLRTAVARGAGARGPVPDAAIYGYMSRGLLVGGRNGRRVPLRPCGVRRSADLLLVCVRAPAPRGMHGMWVYNRMLFELFDDQVNIVQATAGGRKRSVIFTRGTGPKRLP